MLEHAVVARFMRDQRSVALVAWASTRAGGSTSQSKDDYGGMFVASAGEPFPRCVEMHGKEDG